LKQQGKFSHNFLIFVARRILLRILRRWGCLWTTPLSAISLSLFCRVGYYYDDKIQLSHGRGQYVSMDDVFPLRVTLILFRWLPRNSASRFSVKSLKLLPPNGGF